MAARTTAHGGGFGDIAGKYEGYTRVALAARLGGDLFGEDGNFIVFTEPVDFSDIIADYPRAAAFLLRLEAFIATTDSNVAAVAVPAFLEILSSSGADAAESAIEIFELLLPDLGAESSAIAIPSFINYM